jgi:hypothetical protein
LPELFERVSPEDVAHETVGRWLAETIDRLDVLESVKFGTQPAMNTQELFVHDGRERQGAERVHACFVDFLTVLVLAFELESEVVCQVAALVIAAKKPEGVWIPNLEAPDIQHALFSLVRNNL